MDIPLIEVSNEVNIFSFKAFKDKNGSGRVVPLMGVGFEEGS